MHWLFSIQKCDNQNCQWIAKKQNQIYYFEFDNSWSFEFLEITQLNKSVLFLNNERHVFRWKRDVDHDISSETLISFWQFIHSLHQSRHSNSKCAIKINWKLCFYRVENCNRVLNREWKWCKFQSNLIDFEHETNRL